MTPLDVDLGDLDDRFTSDSHSNRTKSPEDVSDAAPGYLTVYGGTGRDTIKTASLPDSISGGPGNDDLDAGLGDDQLSGGSGDDKLFGRDGADVIDGGDGVDSTRWTGSERVVVTLNDDLANDGHDDERDQVLFVENVSGTSAGDKITGNAADNKLEGNGGGHLRQPGVLWKSGHDKRRRRRRPDLLTRPKP